MTFDEARYVAFLTDVVNRGADSLPGIQERYQIEGLRGPELAAQAAVVRKSWPRLRKKTKLLVLIDRMSAEHANLHEAFERAARGDDSQIRRSISGERHQTEERTARFTAEIRELAGATALVSKQAALRLGGSYGLTEAEVSTAISRLGDVRIADPDRLLTDPPVPRFRQYRQSIDALGHRHLLDFLVRTGPCTGLSVLDKFALGAPAGVTLGASAIATSKQYWEHRPRDSSQDHAVAIHAACAEAAKKGPSGLLDLVRYEVADLLRARRRLGTTPSGLLGFATDELRLAVGDARRLVFAILNEDSAVGASAEYLRLHDLVDSDEVYAAWQFVQLATLPSDAAELAEQVRARVNEADRRCTQLRATTQSVDGDQEWREIEAIVAAVPDHPELAGLRSRLRPAAVGSVRVLADGAAVTVHWEKTRSTAGEISYRLVRQSGRPPEHAEDHDGHIRTTEKTAVVDSAPPVNQAVYYGVIACRGDTESALTIAGPLTVRVEPGAVQLEFADAVVEGRWEPVVAMAAVRVRRRETGRHDSQRWVDIDCTRTGFLDKTVVNGRSYQYRVTGVYLDTEGREVETPGTAHTGTPVRTPEPVRRLDLSEEGGTLVLSYDDAPGGHVQIFRLGAATSARWPVGHRLSLNELRAAAERVSGTVRRGGLVIDRPIKAAMFLAVTVVGGTGIVGATADFVPTADLGDVTATAAGDEVVVSMAWPRELEVLDVEWDNAGRTHRRSATFAQYQAGGGLRLRVDRAHPTEVRVIPVVRHGDGIRRGIATVRTIARRIRICYRVDIQGPPWRRELIVELTADAPTRLNSFSLGLRSGRVMPLDVQQCTILGELRDQPISPGAPARLVLPVPRQAKPYWLRGFATGTDIELDDPPHDQMRKG
ncbi:hypothetical protein ACWFRF_22880 [Nocardia sp. NPDC055165]